MDCTTTDDVWTQRTAARDARLRLFCFPAAGGGVATYAKWSTFLPASVHVCPVQLPGRESRLREEPFTELRALVKKLSEKLPRLMDLPFVFYGHSMGGLLAFELAHELQRQEHPAPFHLFVSSARAPHKRKQAPPIDNLPDAAFVEQLRRRYVGIPQSVLEDQELLRLFLPTLRADFAMLSSYTYVDNGALTCPISVFGGLQDAEVLRDDLVAWADLTTGGFKLRMYAGGHFFINESVPPMLQAITNDLFQSLPANVTGGI